jgi:hypothetical protein
MADTTRTTIASGTGNAAVIAPTTGLRLLGFSITEDAGSPAVARASIQEGASAAINTEIAGINLAASGSLNLWFGEHGIPCPGGIYLNRISGTTRAVFYTRVSDLPKQSYEAPSW